MADRQYELVYILPPDSTEAQVAEVQTQIEEVVSRLHGQIASTDNWGRKRLAYEIARHKEGFYVLQTINGSGELMKELDRRLKVMDIVIRQMIVRVDEAKKVYGDLLAKKPDDTTALLGLADIYISEKKWSEATDVINRARTVARSNSAPGLKLVSLYELRQDWNSAKTVAGELAMQFPRDVNVLEAQGRAELGAGDTNGAISSYRRAYELTPNSMPILSRYLSLLNSEKYFTEARGVLQEAVARDPRNAPLNADLIRVESELNGLDAAISKARALADNDPNSNIYSLVVAELYEKADRIGDAIATLEKAVAAKPSDDGLTTALSRLYGRTGDLPKAEAILTNRLKADPKNVTISATLAPRRSAIVKT